jgi:PPOX class probable F420-dependent enzyme
VRLDEATGWERLRSSTHGVLGTVHARRGVDLVPVVFVADGSRLVVPVDTVKAKSGRRLQRLVNLEGDARCTLLVDHHDRDWSRLWWVRAHGRARETPADPVLVSALAAAFPAYRAPGAVTSLIVLDVDEVTGWTA